MHAKVISIEIKFPSAIKTTQNDFFPMIKAFYNLFEIR